LQYDVIKPLLKKGEISLIANYRPISLLTGFSKIVELIFHRLKQHLTQHNILIPNNMVVMTMLLQKLPPLNMHNQFTKPGIKNL